MSEVARGCSMVDTAVIVKKKYLKNCVALLTKQSNFIKWMGSLYHLLHRVKTTQTKCKT